MSPQNDSLRNNEFVRAPLSALSMDNESPPDSQPTGFAAFWQELKRRKVMRVAAAYTVVSWIIIQVSATVLPALLIPEWTIRLVVILVILGFPVAIVLAWAFDLTPEGIKTTKSLRLENGDSVVSKKEALKSSLYKILFAAAIPTLLFGTLAIFFYLRSDSSPTHVTTEQIGGGALELEESVKSIAVLPLTNMSPDQENAFFADGVQEDILTNLSRIQELRVISRTSTHRYRSTDLNLKQIGEELGVHYLVEGSVRRMENQVLVTVQLIDAKTDEHLWAENYNRALDNIFAIQAEIAKTIAEKLQTVLSPQELHLIERRPTENQEAYDAFLIARRFENAYSQKGVELCEQAVGLDPDFAEAWSLLAKQLIIFWRRDYYRQNDELLERATHAIEMARKTGPDIPNSYDADNMFVYNVYDDINASINLGLRALEIDPNFASGQNNLALRYIQLGRIAEARHYYELAVKADPLHQPANIRLAQVYGFLGLWKEAEGVIQRNRKRFPEDINWRRIQIDFAYLHSGDLRQHADSTKELVQFSNSVEGQLWLALQKRDLESAINAIDSYDSSPRFGFGLFHFHNRLMPYEALRFDNLQLLKALLLHEIGNREALQMAVNNATDYYEGVLATDSFRPHRRAGLVVLDALKGDTEGMELRIERVRAETDVEAWRYPSMAISEVRIALAYLILGETDKALESLEAASEMDGPLFLNRELELWFVFDSLKGKPRFEALLKKDR